MTPNQLGDRELLVHTLHLAKAERGLLLEVLRCLKEIDHRRLFSACQYSSLFDYAVRGLGYSEDQAQRRVQALRLLREAPEIEPMIEKGTLTLSLIGLAQGHIQREQKYSGATFTKTEILAVVQLVAGKPARMAERELLKLSRFERPPRPERVVQLSNGLREIRITITQETWEKTERLKSCLAHAHPQLDLGGLFRLTCDLAVENWLDDSHATSRAAPRKSLLHREVWLRDGGRCKNCGSRHALEIDHIRPKSLGGTNAAENLRL